MSAPLVADIEDLTRVLPLLQIEDLTGVPLLLKITRILHECS